MPFTRCKYPQWPPPAGAAAERTPSAPKTLRLKALRQADQDLVAAQRRQREGVVVAREVVAAFHF